MTPAHDVQLNIAIHNIQRLTRETILWLTRARRQMVSVCGGSGTQYISDGSGRIANIVGSSLCKNVGLSISVTDRPELQLSWVAAFVRTTKLRSQRPKGL